MHRPTRLLLVLALSTALPAQSDNWPAFRGAGHFGAASDAKLPTEWSDTKNMAWKTWLPGAGSSSPIVVGDRVFVTCWSGYGLDMDDPGDLKKLTRHLVCVDRKTGKILWDKKVLSDGKDLVYRAQVTGHGYATPTPAADGERVFAYFGRSLHAFDHEGKPVWDVKLATATTSGRASSGGQRNRGGFGGSRGGFGGRRGGFGGGGGGYRWGIAASLALHGDVVMCNAEGKLQAFDTKTGKPRWQHETSTGAGSSPIVVNPKDGEPLAIVLTSGEVHAIDIATGELAWKFSAGGGRGRGGANASPVADQEHVYAPAGRGSAAIRLRLPKEEGASRVAWRNSRGADIPSVALHDGRIYLVSQRATASVVDAKTGKEIFGGRLPGRPSGGIYASPVVANGHLYVLTRRRGAFVYSLDGKFELTAKCSFGKDKSEFNASPAVVGDQMFVRSDEYLYCIQAKQ